jgi:hypothetical protein
MQEVILMMKRRSFSFITLMCPGQSFPLRGVFLVPPSVALPLFRYNGSPKGKKKLKIDPYIIYDPYQ